MTTGGARVDLRAHSDSVRLDLPVLVDRLRALLGARLVAYLGSVDQTRTVGRWADGIDAPTPEVVRRLRSAYHVAAVVAEVDSAVVAQTLDVIVMSFKQGKSPEAIHESFDTVSLADVYAVLAYYLRHWAEVEVYLAEQERLGAETRSRIEAAFPPEGLRAKLLARLDT